MRLTTLLWIVVLLFPVSEVILGFWKRANRSSARSEDQGSLRLLWLVIGASVGLAIVFQSIRIGRVHESLTMYRAIALGLFLGGFAIRWSSIITLGRLFTVDVAIHRDHTLVDRGFYRYIRHPSYTGLLMIFLGLGISFENWLSLCAIIVPATLAILNRISKEEAALHGALGDSYTAYCARTKRLLPGVI